MSWDIYQPGDDEPHVNADTCGKCRKKFTKGHRVHAVNIVSEVGCNPENLKERGCELFFDFEMVHVDCHDPLLKRGLYK